MNYSHSYKITIAKKNLMLDFLITTQKQKSRIKIMLQKHMLAIQLST